MGRGMLSQNFHVTTERLIIRPYTADDLESVRAKFIDEMPSMTERDMTAKASGKLSTILTYAAKGESYSIAAFHREAPTRIALDINLSAINDQKFFWEVGYYAMKEARQKKLMSEAIPPVLGEFVRAIRALGFFATVRTSNEPSQKILLNNGFCLAPNTPSLEGWQSYYKDCRPKLLGR